MDTITTTEAIELITALGAAQQVELHREVRLRALRKLKAGHGEHGHLSSEQRRTLTQRRDDAYAYMEGTQAGDNDGMLYSRREKEFYLTAYVLGGYVRQPGLAAASIELWFQSHKKKSSAAKLRKRLADLAGTTTAWKYPEVVLTLCDEGSDFAEALLASEEL